MIYHKNLIRNTKCVLTLKYQMTKTGLLRSSAHREVRLDFLIGFEVSIEEKPEKSIQDVCTDWTYDKSCLVDRRLFYDVVMWYKERVKI